MPKLGDTAPAFKADLNADITGATSVRVYFRKLDGTAVFDRALTVTDALNGIVQYQWVTANDGALINTDANFLWNVRVTFANGQIETFPQRWDGEWSVSA